MFHITRKDGYFSVKAQGKLTHKDYIENLILAIEEILKDGHDLVFLMDMTDLKG